MWWGHTTSLSALCSVGSARLSVLCFFFFFNDTATTEIYTLSLHDALPIFGLLRAAGHARDRRHHPPDRGDRKSTRLNSSHLGISYAVFCLKKKKINHKDWNCRCAILATAPVHARVRWM